MGRIKTQLIKRASRKIADKYSAELSEDFAKNKESIMKFAEINSKKLLNSIAGYVTRIVRMKKKSQ